MEKRPLSPSGDEGEERALALKKARTQGDEGDGLALAPAPRTSKTADAIRTSDLAAPNMLLTGHGADVFSLKFSPDGAKLASGSHDKSVMLWNTFGDCESTARLEGHKNAVLEVHWAQEGSRLVSCGADTTARSWDAAVGVQLKNMTEHSAIVNTCCPAGPSRPLIVTAGNDCKAKVWDLRRKHSVHTFEEALPIVASAWSADADAVYLAGIENDLHAWDLRKGAVALTMKGHTDTVTGLALSPDGTHMLSNAMDNTLRVWDLRPYAPANRCTSVFMGHAHGLERNILRCAWSSDGQRVTAGSADQMVYVWGTSTRSLQYKLPGHVGAVNEAVLHPTQPIIASCSSDKQIFLGEIAPSRKPADSHTVK